MAYDTSEVGEVGLDIPEESSGGVSRRDALKKGAMAGGAVLWATPIVQNIGMSRAFGNTTTPVGTGISFISFRFTCDGVVRVAKVEDIESATQYTCEGPNSGENCGVDQTGAETGCGFFTLSDLVFSNTAELLSVRVTLNCTNGEILAASTRCGLGNSGCNSETSSGNSATFACA